MSDILFEAKLPNHHYRTEIPNIIRELGLDPFEIAVYFHIKSITGDGGSCWQSLKKLEETIKIGETKLRECLNNLVEGKNSLNLCLLTKSSRKKEDGSLDTTVYTVVDIWQINGDHFREKSKGGTSPREVGVPRQTREGTSPREDKEEHYKEEPLKNGLADAGLAEEMKEIIHYTGRNRRLMTITRSDIHRHFLGKSFSAKSIDSAIDKFTQRKGEIGDVFKLIEIIINDTKNTAHTKEESKYIKITKTSKIRV